MMTITKTFTVAASALAVVAVLCGAIWIAKAADPAPPSAITAPAPQQYAKLAPFAEIQWRPFVRLQGKWVELQRIDGQDVQDIFSFIRKKYGPDMVQKRFEEDLVEVLTRMGHPPGNRAELVVETSVKGVNFPFVLDAPMTSANRNALWAARNLPN